MPKPVVDSRRSLAQMLDERMVHSYSTLKAEKRLEAEGSLVKSYLLEAHLREDAEPDAVLDTLLEATKLGASQASPPAVVKETDEKLFFEVATQAVTLYVDASNTRFWVAHSLSNSVYLDRVVERLTSSPRLDRAWLFAQFLETTSERGSFRGLGLAYDRRTVPDIDLDAADSPVGEMKMQLWHSKAADVLKVLRREFPSATALSKVKVKYWEKDSPESFCLDDVKFNGKITARGTSFHAHMTFLSSIYRQYEETVHSLERTHRLRWTTHENERLSVEGAPVNFHFGTPIANLDRFCELIFAANPPFRLWGVPVPVSDTFYRVSAVDLHVGSQLEFEISAEYIRMYFSKETCGNTVLRFFTNLQHHYDATVVAADADGNNIFGN